MVKNGQGKKSEISKKMWEKKALKLEESSLEFKERILKQVKNFKLFLLHSRVSTKLSLFQSYPLRFFSKFILLFQQNSTCFGGKCYKCAYFKLVYKTLQQAACCSQSFAFFFQIINLVFKNYFFDTSSFLPKLFQFLFFKKISLQVFRVVMET